MQDCRKKRDIAGWALWGLTLALLVLAWRLEAAVLTDDEAPERPRLLVDKPPIFKSGPVTLSGTNSPVDFFIEQARKRFQSEDNAGALEALTRANEMDPRNVDVLLGRAWLYINLGQYSQALDLTLRARLLAPHDPTPDLLAGYCYHALGMFNESIESYNRALRFPTPHTAEIHQNIGLLYIMRGDVTNGIRHYAAAVSIKPKDAEAHDKYGAALFLGHRYTDAVEQHREAIAINPAAIETFNSLGAALLMEGRIRDSIPNFKEAIARKERFAKAYSNLGAAYELAGFLDESINALIASLTMEPGRSDAWRNLLKTMSRFYGVATLTPDNPVPLTRKDPEMARRHLEAAKGCVDKKLATGHYLRALLFDPDGAIYYKELANFFEQTGNVSLAKVILKKAELVETAAKKDAETK